METEKKQAVVEAGGRKREMMQCLTSSGEVVIRPVCSKKVKFGKRILNDLAS
jgi:hypothetical protein